MEVSKINKEDHKSKLFDCVVANTVHRYKRRKKVKRINQSEEIWFVDVLWH